MSKFTWPELDRAALLGDVAIAALVNQHPMPFVDGRRVTFVFQGEADGVYLQHWVFGLVSRIPFQRLQGTTWWQLTLELPLRSRIEYKIGVLQGGQETWIHDPFNARVAHDPFGGNSVVQVTGYAEPEWSFPIEEGPQGDVESWKIASKAFHQLREVKV